MNIFRPLVLFSLLLAASPSGAGNKPKPGDAQVEEPDQESGERRIEIFDNKPETLCKIKGRICLKAGTGTASEGSEAAPTFTRRNGAKGDWILDLFGNLKKAAAAGNTQFKFLEKKDVTASYQATVKAGAAISARARLSPDEGFNSGHSYHVQIVQLIGGKENILAEADFQLK
jgi:hypothetical protein